MKERVLEVLTNLYDAISFEDLMNRLELNTPEEIKELQDVLNELEASNNVRLTKKNKYILLEHQNNMIVGTIQVKEKVITDKNGNKKTDRFGFLLVEDGKDIHISKDGLNGAFDGDTVLVEVLGTNPTKPEGKVLKIQKRSDKNIVGEIKVIASKKVFVSNDYKNTNIILDQEELNKCVEGEIVAVSIDNELTRGDNYYGVIKARVGHKDAPGMDILEIAAQYDVFEEFPADAVEQANNLPTEVREQDKYGRRDLTDKMIFTIDGADTKDIDDAISIDDLPNGNKLLGVHIADVSHYITDGSPLDVEALKRGTSNYPADKVIPMLPHIISNGICSLNEGVERLAISCEMEINGQGRVVSSEVFPSVIKSRKKMTYTDCNKLLENEVPEGYEEFKDTLLKMNELHKLIRKERQGRGAIDFDTTESKAVFDENHHAIDFVARERGEYEKLIEDFMICANESVAKKFAFADGFQNGLPSIYRVHDVPNPEKVQQFLTFCRSVGQNIVGKFKTIENSKVFQKLLAQITAEGEEREIIMKMAVRSMAKAVYQKTNIGHFGLASPYYTHFTSPIRRYPDLQIHRLLRTYFFDGLTDKKTVAYWDPRLDEIAKHSSDREKIADELERAVDDMYMADYMTDHINEEFDATISGITQFGLFVQLPNRVEGLLKFENMPGDQYTFDEANNCAIAKYSNKIYRIGSKIHVKCISASKMARQVDFEQVKNLSNEKADRHGRTK